MAILNGCELHYVKLDPENPSKKLNKNNPTWEAQLRAYTKEQAQEWRNAGLRVTAVRDDEESPIKYWRANVRRKKFKANGEEADCPDLIDGDLKAVDPRSVGNGSIGNVRLFFYDYEDRESGTAGKAAVLMGIQLTKHIIYVPRERDDDDDFGTTTTEVIDNTDEEGGDGNDAPASNSQSNQTDAGSIDMSNNNASVPPEEIY